MAANPGQDQIARWKAAIAARHQAQRRQRHQPRPRGAQAVNGRTVTGAGMLRIQPRRDDDGQGQEDQ